MLSGAFLIANDKICNDCKTFYKKSFIKIGIPAIICSILYTVYTVLKDAVSGMNVNEAIGGALFDLIIGKPFYHLWYIFTLSGLYLATPLVISLKKISNKKLKIVGTALLVVSSISYLMSKHILMWDIGYQVYFMGYFIIGYVIRQWGLKNKSNLQGIIKLIYAGLVCGCIVILRYFQAVGGIGDNELAIPLVDPLSPLIILFSILVFTGFSQLEINLQIKRNIMEVTLYIYLLHAGVWDLLLNILIRRSFIYKYSSAVIIIGTIMVFVISIFISIFFKRLIDFLIFRDTLYSNKA